MAGILPNCPGHERKRKPKKLSHIKGTEETWQRNALWDSGLALEQAGDMSGKPGSI